MFIAALFTIAKTWKQSKCLSIDKWIKMWGVCVYVCVCLSYYIVQHTYTEEYYTAIKKNETVTFAATWMNLEIMILSDISHRKANTIMISLICGI